MGILTAIWTIVEPLLFFIKALFNFLPYSKLTVGQFSDLMDKAFDDSVDYVESYGLKSEKFAPAPKGSYLDRAYKHFKFRNGQFTKIIDGRAEEFFINQFDLPRERRFKVFLIHSYFLSTYKKPLLEYYMVKEKFLKALTRRTTTLHYFSIPNWRNRKHNELIHEVEKISKIDLRLNEIYNFDKLRIEEDSKVVSLLNAVLAGGKISTEAILKLTATEKLIIVNKYAEGFGDAYQEQISEKNNLTQRIEKIKARKAKGRKSIESLEHLQTELDELNKSWITAPVGRILERKGFQRLFSRNDGIFFLPLSLMPSKYNRDYKRFIEEEIIVEAGEYFESIRHSKYLTDDHHGLSYMMVSYIIQVNQLTVLSKNRTIEITTPHLAKMLMTSYFLTATDETAQLYINDVVRNVDFLSGITNTKTGTYLKKNFEAFKAILWKDNKIDIFKPVNFSTLSLQAIEEIVGKMTAIDSNVQSHRLKQLLLDQVDFYTKLKLELDQIRKKK